jgi:hypothetical protein
MRSFPKREALAFPPEPSALNILNAGFVKQTLQPEGFAKVALGFLPVGRPGRSMSKVYAYARIRRNWASVVGENRLKTACRRV